MKIIFENTEMSWEKMSLTEFLESNTPIFWKDFFDNEEIKQKLLTISNFLRYEASHPNIQIYPNITNVFQSIYLLNPIDINLVIIGQDPYHDGSATGIAFDVDPFRKKNPSLRNIIKELENCNYSDISNLSEWKHQGVLLLNTALTVRSKCPDSHCEIWSEFTQHLLNFIIKSNKNLVWLLMGTKAQAFSNLIPKSHIIIKTTHPSPLSAYKSTKKIPAFINSDCFKNINNALVTQGKSTIQY